MRSPLPIALLLLLTACGADDRSSAEPSAPDGPASTATAPATSAPPTTAAPTTPTATTVPAPQAATSAPSEPATPSTTDRTETTVNDSSEDQVADDIVASPIVQTAIADLRERLSDPAAEVTVVSVEEVDWPDGSIGCPQPGMVYTQAIVNGTKIVLKHAGIRYDYHQGGSREVFYCPPGQATSPTTGRNPDQ